ncbi:MAG: tetratricopeptide repeat protein [Bacteroidales bacterium]|nr:tetratricopeptide repeat protein [Bacteroidales bacterium]
MKQTLLAIFLLSFPILMMGNNSAAELDSATAAYTAGNYQKAIWHYQKVVDMKLESAELYYNLGNSWFKLNEMAPAILYYEKALRLDPNHADIQFNLKVANSRIVDKIDEVPQLFYERWWSKIKNLFNGNRWAFISLISFGLMLSLGILFFLTFSGNMRRLSFWSGLTIMLIFFISSGFAWQARAEKIHHNQGIVFTQSVSVKSSPDQSSTDLFVIHEGTKVRITERIGEWIEVRIANGSTGWIQKNDLKEI